MAAAGEPIAPHLRRALLWIKLANDGGVYPSRAQLDEKVHVPILIGSATSGLPKPLDITRFEVYEVTLTMSCTNPVESSGLRASSPGFSTYVG
jgi:hypothetical protein